MKQTQELSESMLKLPILSNFGKENLITKSNTLKPGAKIVYLIMLIGALAGAGWLFYFVLLPVLTWMMQVIAAGVITIAAFILYRPFVSFLQSVARSLHKFAIENDPFLILERQKSQIYRNRTKVYESQGQIALLRDDMKSSASQKAKEVMQLTTNLRSMRTKYEKLLAEKEAYTGAKDDDEYINLSIEISKLKSEIVRDSHMLEQSDALAQRYAIRGKKMGDLHNKLKIIISSMDSKIADYEVSIQMLKVDYEYARKAKAATNAALGATIFDKDWKVKYAIDVIENTVANDLSQTEMNMKDLDAITKNFDIDDDAVFANVDKLLSDIDSGNKKLTDTKAYNSPEYKETESDRAASSFKMFK